MTTFLKGPHVTMRPVAQTDLPLLAKWINDPEVRIYLGTVKPITLEDEAAWYKALQGRSDTNMVLIIEVDGKPIGNMGIHRINAVSGTAETGALIGEKEYWGKGYGKEAKMLLLYHAFHTLNLRKINSRVFAYNKRSVAYSLASGYKEEGRLIDQHYRDGKYWDEVILSIFREDWEPRWLTFKEEHDIVTIPTES
jgi:RimJ/RimL family protein N-acetyltransferase